MGNETKTYVFFNLETRKINHVTVTPFDTAEESLHPGEGFVIVPNGYDGKIDCRMVSPTGEVVDDPNWAAPVVDPLDNIRAERNALLRDTLWTQMPDAPLTAACTEAFRAWRVSLNRWLIDYPDGETALPLAPDVVYAPLDQQV